MTLQALSTSEVTRLCERVVEGTKCDYLGTYSAWGGPDVATWADKTRKCDTAFVANTDTIEDEGTHWVLFYLPQDTTKPPYFFDSFGRDPAHMGRPLWRNYLRAIADRRMHGKTASTRPVWERNKVRIQEPHTAVCGQLCGLALYLLSRGLNLPKKIVQTEIIEDFIRDV